MFLVLYFNCVLIIVLLSLKIVLQETIPYGVEEGGASEEVFGLNLEGL
jgi:membrane associated rhomboid family serine protease